MKIIYSDHWVFGGLKDRPRIIFFVLPCVRLVILPFFESTQITIGLGILFWEFIFTIEIQK